MFIEIVAKNVTRVINTDNVLAIQKPEGHVLCIGFVDATQGFDYETLEDAMEEYEFLKDRLLVNTGFVQDIKQSSPVNYRMGKQV